MTSNTPAPSIGATAKHTLQIAEDRSRLLNPGEPQKFSTSLDGQPVVTRSTVPMYDSCRVLRSWGFTGKVEFVGANGIVCMTMHIDEGAKLTVSESPRGIRAKRFVAPIGSVSGKSASLVSQSPERAEQPLAVTLHNQDEQVLA